ncbi:serine/threonine protein phosphatase [Pseudohongiella nitratireducens]|uniref:Serine/threonine protein phosphatase n=1 Tax=Pseudohongiella nitratireducens TaxID=1768907 RepID=A0A917GID1_9GAMM|nr:metallophosphoesterase [Pseudohongiella nitratireducens]GGG46976.1 serine/threonine protein phosphatase [Pseudohongiella nitratireducens]
MKIRLYSDLHLEFSPFNPPDAVADLVVLAGDIHVGVKGVEWALEQSFGCPVLYVLGNHEFYGKSYPGLIHKMKLLAQGSPIHVLENESIEIDGVRFHGATLWTDFELFGDAPMAGFECQQVMNDFRKIRKEPSYSKLRAMDAAAIHQRSIAWLGRSLHGSTAATNVVVSHHAPGLGSVNEEYHSSVLSAAYASDLASFISEHRPDYWLHGHTHSCCDYQIGTCRVICNQRGYHNGEIDGFIPDGIITIHENPN